MAQVSEDEFVIKQYLLGELDEDGQRRVEERLFIDDEYFERVQMVEDDLVEDYVLGALTKADAARFEAIIMSAPERRANVHLSAALRKRFAARQPAQSQAEQPHRRWQQRLPAFLRNHGLMAGASFALAALLLVVGLALLWRASGHGGNQNDQIVGESERERREDDLKSQLAREQRRSEELARELEERKREYLKLQQELDETRSAAARKGAPATSDEILLGLMPDQTMGGSGSTVALRPGVRWLRLELNLPEGNLQNYRAELQSEQAGQVWESEKLRARKSRHALVLSLRIPATSLSKGNYELVVKGESRPGKELTRLASYHFRVE